MRRIAERLDGAALEHPILRHRFYTAWAEGTLTLDDLRFYATQYWRQVEAFPGYLEGLADRLPSGPARAVVVDNLSDERDDDHPDLWLRFAAALGMERDAVTGAVVEAETHECVAAFDDAARTAPIPFALGMLYGYESQTPRVADTKVAGLREHYGIDGDGVEYFRLHGVLDVEHAGELVRAIDDVCSDERDLAAAELGARAGARALWHLLDGVARVRGIN